MALSLLPSPLHDFSILQDNYTTGVDYGWQPMCNHNCSFSSTDIIQRFLYVALSGCIQCWGGLEDIFFSNKKDKYQITWQTNLIEKKDIRSFQNSPSYSHTLFFTSTEFQSTFSNHSVVPIREAGDLVMNISSSSRILYFLITCCNSTIPYVVPR